MEPVAFRVVGVRPDSSREVITEHTSRDGAECVLRLIRHNGEYHEMVIEPPRPVATAHAA